MPVTTRLECAGLSDPGRKRDNNEDRLHFDAKRRIFLVVDGVGGQAAGEKASSTAVQVIRARMERPSGTAEARIREAIALANNEIFRLAAENQAWNGMACVLTLAVIEEGRLFIGHVGDSRAYLIADGEIRKLTHDHSPIGEREDRGELSEAEAMRHPRRNEVFRDVGGEEHRPDDPDFIELIEQPFPPEAALLLCSDGLSDLVGSDEIRQCIESNAGRPKLAAQALIDAANEAGGKDNITVIVVEGPRFAASPRRQPTGGQAEETPPAIVAALSTRWAWFAYGVVFAVLSHFALKSFSRPAPGERAPRVIAAGAGETVTTISGALETAQSGDTIVLGAGEYRETVRLKDGVSLTGKSGQVVTVISPDAAIIADRIHSARVTGLRIQGGSVGIVVADSGVEIAGCEVSGAGVAGIEIAGAADPLIAGSRIAGNPGLGILIRDGATPRILRNLITGNGRAPRSPKPGIRILGTSRPLLRDNLIYDNGAEPVWTSPLFPESEIVPSNFFGTGVRAPARGKPALVKVVSQ